MELKRKSNSTKEVDICIVDGKVHHHHTCGPVNPQIFSQFLLEFVKIGRVIEAEGFFYSNNGLSVSLLKVKVLN